MCRGSLLILIALAAIHPASRAQDMIRIPAGPFTMGSNDGRDDERPAHAVTLAAFEIDRLQVTNAGFARFLDRHGATDTEGRRYFDWDDGDARIRRVDGAWRADPGFEDHPVVEASWLGALAYCRSLGKRLERHGCRERPCGASEPLRRGRDGGQRWHWVSSAYRPYPYRDDDGREDSSPGPVRATRGGGHDSSAEALRTTERGRTLSRAPAAGGFLTPWR